MLLLNASAAMADVDLTGYWTVTTALYPAPGIGANRTRRTTRSISSRMGIVRQEQWLRYERMGDGPTAQTDDGRAMAIR